MPLNVDLNDSLAHMGAGGGGLAYEDAIDGKTLIVELKLALIGNRDLKQRLLRDDTFPSWFCVHLQKCVDTFSATDLSEDANQDPANSVLSNENPMDMHESENSTHCSPTSSPHGPLSAITDLGDAIIVLRLLLAHSESASNSSISPPSSMSSVSSFSMATMDACAPVVLALVSILSDKTLQKLTYASPEVSLLMQILGDTTRVLSLLAESSRSAFNQAHSHVLWTFLSQLLNQFVQFPGKQVALSSVISDAYKLLPFLLDLEPKFAEPFLLQSIRFLELQLEELFPCFLQEYPEEDGEKFPRFPTVMSDTELLKSNTTFHVVSCVTVAVAQVFNLTKDTILSETSAELQYLLSTKFYSRLRVLLFADDNYVLNVAALNLFSTSLSKSTCNKDNGQSLRMFGNIFSRIIELLTPVEDTSQNVPSHLWLPITILSDLCLEYPVFCAHLKKTGVDKRIMESLAELIDSSPLLSFLHTAKGASKRSKKIADLSILRRNLIGQKSVVFSAYTAEMNIVSSYLLLLSVFTCSNEDYRRRITSFRTSQECKNEPNFLCLALFEIVENYTFLSTQLLLCYKSFFKLQNTPKTESGDRLILWLSENVSVILALLEHPFFTSAFYLMRSLSRSVSILRTFFVDCNSIRSSFEEEMPPVTRDPHLDSKGHVRSVIGTIGTRYDREAAADKEGNMIYCLLKTISRMHSLDQTMMFFASTKTGSTDAQCLTRKALAEKKVIIFATLANLILDFSSFRHEIVNHERFLGDLANILKKSIMSKRQCEISQYSNESHDIALEQMKVQLVILQVIKNYLYNENEESRRIVWDYVSLATIFEFSLYGVSIPVETESELHKFRLKQKVLAFEILRNLTAASAHFSEAIGNLYEEYAATDPTNSQHPRSWNSYLLENILAHDLFVTLPNGTGITSWWSLENAQLIDHVLGDADYVKLIVAINYLEDHRYTNISSFQESDFPKQSLLRVWKRLLGVSLTNVREKRTDGPDIKSWVKLCNQVNEIKISISWILINLTWRDDAGARQLRQRSDFRLMDIISSTGDSVSRANAVRSSGRAAENYEVSDTRRLFASTDHLSSDGIMSPKDRARLLYEAGFCRVLERLMDELVIPRYTSDKDKQIAVARFDSLNSDDLYEKCKTAQFQILSLISRDKDIQSAQINEQNRRGHDSSHLSRSSSNIGSRVGPHARTEGDREGGNFGNRTDDDRLEQEGSREEESEMQDVTAEESDPMVEDEEFDEYWIR